jgi:hypothetical protein
MGFPKLSEVSMYPITIPSSGIQTRFRPYLVKEEKILLVASEQNDPAQINQSVLDLVRSCLEDDVGEKDLTAFDVEYLFCNIRAKSVGEKSTLALACSHDECYHQTEVDIRIDQAEMDMGEQKDNIIKINDDVSIEMGYITYHDIIKNNKVKDTKTDAEVVYLTTLMSIKAVLTEEERIDVSAEPFEELVDFVNNMTTEQFNLLKEFALNTPEVKLDVTWECESCKKENKMELRGIADFF